MAAERFIEAEKMRRIPGIVFAQNGDRRVPRISGTGIEVFEVIKTFRALDWNGERLREAYDWLTEGHLRAALAYYEAYPDEVPGKIGHSAGTSVIDHPPCPGRSRLGTIS